MFATLYGWAPRQVCELTLAQIDMLLGGATSPKGTKQFSCFRDAMAFREAWRKKTEGKA